MIIRAPAIANTSAPKYWYPNQEDKQTFLFGCKLVINKLNKHNNVKRRKGPTPPNYWNFSMQQACKVGNIAVFSSQTPGNYHSWFLGSTDVRFLKHRDEHTA